MATGNSRVVIYCFGCLKNGVGAGEKPRAGSGSGVRGQEGEGGPQQDKTLLQLLSMLWGIPVEKVESMFSSVQGSALCSKCQAPVRSFLNNCYDLKNQMLELQGMFGERGGETSTGSRKLRIQDQEEIRKDRALVKEQLTKKILQLSGLLGFGDCGAATGTASGLTDNSIEEHERQGQGPAQQPKAVTVKTGTKAKVSGAGAKKMPYKKIMTAKNQKRLENRQVCTKVRGVAKKKIKAGKRPARGFAYQCGVCKKEFCTANLLDTHAKNLHPKISLPSLAPSQAEEAENNLAMELHELQAPGQNDQDQGVFGNGTVQLPAASSSAGSCRIPRKRLRSRTSCGTPTGTQRLVISKKKRTAPRTGKSGRAKNGIATAKRKLAKAPLMKLHFCDKCRKGFTLKWNRDNHFKNKKCFTALGRPRKISNDAAASASASLASPSALSAPVVENQASSSGINQHPETPVLPVVPERGGGAGREEGDDNAGMDIFQDAVDTSPPPRFSLMGFLGF